MPTAYIYYGHSSLALVIFVGLIVLRMVSAQRRRSGSRPQRPRQAPPAPVSGFTAGTPASPSGPVPPPAPPAGAPTDTGTAAAWMRDPFFRHEHRWWSGSAWTEHVSDDGVASVDPPPAP